MKHFLAHQNSQDFNRFSCKIWELENAINPFVINHLSEILCRVTHLRWNRPFILSANINRRHMTKSQRAMVVAKITPMQQGKKKTSSISEEVSSTHISRARTVLRHAPDLAASVIAGHISLDNAYEEARIRKGRTETYESRFNALKAAAPDLAELVVEGQLNLEEAQAAYDQPPAQPTSRGKFPSVD
jgi:hypothetical protein